MVIKQGTVNFWTTGENLTRLARDFWIEGRLDTAIKILRPLSIGAIMEILEGKAKLIGSDKDGGHMTVVEDGENVELTEDRLERFLKFKNGKIEELETDLREFVDDALDEIEWEEEGNPPLTVNERAARREIKRRLASQKEALGEEYERVLEEQLSYAGIKAEEFREGRDTEDFIEEMKEAKEKEVKSGQFFKELTPEELAESGLPEDPFKAFVRLQELEDELKESVLEPDDFELAGGWLSPTGDWYSCHWMEHQTYAHYLTKKFNLEPKEDDEDVRYFGFTNAERLLEEKGWMKVLAPGESVMNTTSRHSLVWLPKRGSSVERAGPTKGQQNAIWDWAKKHNIEHFDFNFQRMNYREFLEHIEEERGRV
jgi:hypothetical protein